MKTYKRIFSVFLLLSLLVSFCFAPVQVSATEGLIEIATSWGETARVAPCLLPIILILIGVDWYYSNIDEIVAKADSIYNSASSSLRNWADDVAQQIIDGTSVFKISTVAKNEINKRVESDNKKLPDNLPYLIVPPSFRSIDALSQEDVLIGEISGIVENIQEGVTDTNSILNRIQTYIYNSNEQLRKWQVKLNSNITNRLLTIRQTIANMKNALHTTLLRINTSIADLQNSLKTTLLNIEGSINTIQTSFKTTLLRINTSITDTRIALRSEFFPPIKEGIISLGDKIVNLQTLLETKLQALIANSSTTADPGQIPSFEGGDDGQQKIPYVIDNGKDIFSKYSNTFLAISAILTAFIELPVVGDLVQFGLALGVFALVVNLANQLISADDKNSAKSRKTRSLKGG